MSALAVVLIDICGDFVPPTGHLPDHLFQAHDGPLRFESSVLLSGTIHTADGSGHNGHGYASMHDRISCSRQGRAPSGRTANGAGLHIRDSIVCP